jgi:lysophospholipase L1-like esterase
MRKEAARLVCCVGLGILLLPSSLALAQSPQLFADDTTRYLALGDSVAAGFRALPTTNGYPYLLYRGGVFDRIPHTLFANIAYPGATSTDVLAHQIPEACIPSALGGLAPGYITLTAGGNDLVAVVRFAAGGASEPEVIAYAQRVIANYAQNLTDILVGLRMCLPNAKIFISNQYSLPDIEQIFPATSTVIAALNQAQAQVVAAVALQTGGNIHLVDVASALAGKSGVLLADRHQAPFGEVHLTNAGQRVFAKAFADVILANK